MQAIQIRYLGATTYRGVRLKAFSEAGSITEGRDYESECAADQAERLANRFATEMYAASVVVGFGQLPNNGDWVATLGANRQ